MRLCETGVKFLKENWIWILLPALLALAVLAYAVFFAVDCAIGQPFWSDYFSTSTILKTSFMRYR